MTNTNSSRWNDLNEKYAKAIDIGSDDAFRVTRFAMHIRKQFAVSCGCQEEYVSYYKYDFSHSPEYDTSERVKLPRDAINKQNFGWCFGLGLELGGLSTGRTIFVFSMDLRVQPDQFDVRCSLFSGEETVDTTPPHYGKDIAKLAERMFSGFSTNLDALSGQTQSSLGFKF